MFPINLEEADLAGYDIFYFLLIVKAIYLIFYNYFQTRIKSRMRLFKAIKWIYFFVIIPLYLVWITIALKQYIREDLGDFKLSQVYWKVVTLLIILLITSIILLILHPTVKKGITFLKRNDRNEVKYQSMFKKVRSNVFTLIFIDVIMLLFLNKVAS